MSAPIKRKRNDSSAPSTPAEPTGRRSARNKDRLTDDPGEAGGHGVLYQLGEDEDGREAKAGSRQTQVRNSSQDVERAMRNLQHMEDSLQKVVKRQQRAVETSHLSTDGNDSIAAETTLPVKHAPPHRSGKDQVVNRRDKEDPKSTEQAPLNNHEADLEEGDLDAEPIEDAADRGARRPPPVNSEKLPLPWKGRLGYVRPDNPGWNQGQLTGLDQTMKTEELTDPRDLGMPQHLFESFEPTGLLL